MKTTVIMLSFFLVAFSSMPAQTPGLTQLPLASATDPLGQGFKLNPLTMPTLSSGELELIKLEADFADSVAKGGGKAFASWFADDGVTLQNGKPPVRGRSAIAAGAVWDPKDYQLTWYADGAQMAPGEMSGFTWGHYTSTSKDSKGQPLVLGGRYITFWKKVKGAWKVALDASADDVPAGADCCALPKP